MLCSISEAQLADAKMVFSWNVFALVFIFFISYRIAVEPSSEDAFEKNCVQMQYCLRPPNNEQLAMWRERREQREHLQVVRMHLYE